MTIQFQPLSNDLYSIPKAQILFQPLGSTEFELLGDSDTVTIETTVEEVERYSNETGTKKLAKTITTQIDVEVKMELVQLSDRNRALSLMGELGYKTQAALVAETKSLTAPTHDGTLIKLDGHINTSNMVITDGATTVPYVLDVDYTYDAKGGFVQLLQVPAGGDLDVEMTFDVAEILVADKAALIGLGSKPENRGTIIIRGTNDVGPQTMVTLHDVQIRPDGERSYISDTDLDVMSLVGRVFSDPTQPTGEELGIEQLIL